MTHIHLIAACGTGMGSLAGLFKEKGFTVTGSDQNIYPPMSTELESLGVTLYKGFSPENLKQKPDLIIVGNAVSKNNPEVEEMLKLGIPYLSMPQALSQFFITGKKSIVVSGTHGKTTTTAIISHLLLAMGDDPSYLVGGILQKGEKNYRNGAGNHFVIEGDEYDTAFFDKGPKFLHYQPYYTLITSLEFDHADIYRDLDHLTSSFEKLIATTHPSGTLFLLKGTYPKLDELIKTAETNGRQVITYGLENADFTVKNISYQEQTTQFEVLEKNLEKVLLSSPLPGEHNVLNVLVSYALARTLGFSPKEIALALSSFQGVKRRQEIRGIVNDMIVIDDFAHHPTAVQETIHAIKKRYPKRPLISIFEPRSNSSKRNIFQDSYAHSFTGSTEVILADVFMPEKVKEGTILDVDLVAKALNMQGIKSQHLSGIDTIVDYVVKMAPPSSVILIMSNGGFGGIHEKLLNKLKKIHASL